MSLTITSNVDGLLSWLRSRGKAVEVYREELLYRSELILTGELKKTAPGGIKETVTSLIMGNVVRVWPTHPAAGYVERGTRAHIIRPREKQALRFAVIAPGGIMAGGMYIFAKVVHHPGFPGRFFIREAAEKAKPRIVALVRELWERAMRSA